MKLADVRYEWSIKVFEVYSFWYLYKSPNLMDGTTVEMTEKSGNTQVIEAKDFSIGMVVTWSTTVKKKTSASWVLTRNVPINKAHTHIHSHTYIYTRGKSF